MFRGVLKGLAVIPVDWWVRLRNTKPFETALQRAFNTLYFEAVAQRLRENKQNRRFPATWANYTEAMATSRNGDLKIDPGKTYRKRSGSQELRIRELLPTPLLIESPLDVLIPDFAAVLKRAAQHIARGEVSPEEASVFVDYCLLRYERDRDNRLLLRELGEDAVCLEQAAAENGLTSDQAANAFAHVRSVFQDRLCEAGHA